MAGLLIDGFQRVQGGLGLTPSQLDAVHRAAVWPGPPNQVVHVWGLALRICAEHRPDPGLHEAASRLGQAILTTRPLPTELERSSGLPVLELLVLVAAQSGAFDLAHDAVVRVRARTNELFLDLDLGAEYLWRRPDTLLLRSAAAAAFEAYELELAVDCMEAGRMKVLSAVAAGIAPPHEDAVHSGSTLLSDSAAELLLKIYDDPDRPANATAVDLLRAGDELAAAARSLTTPWLPLLSLSPSDRKKHSAAPIAPEVWSIVVQEPTVERILKRLPDHAMLAYPVVAADYVGVVLLAGGQLGSGIVRRNEMSELPVKWEDSGRNHFLGMCIEETAYQWADQAIEGGELTDVLLVDWSPHDSGAVSQLRDGWTEAACVRALSSGAGGDSDPRNGLLPAVLPSARLLRPEPEHLSEAPSVWFLGDPSGNLGGPWIEAERWARDLPTTRFSMHFAATGESFLEALTTADLVVLSGHGMAEQDGGVHLVMHDRLVSHQELLGLAGEVRATQVMLSCCFAGSVRRSIAVEAMGVSTCLLALGVDVVLAPLQPVADLPAAVVGRLITEQVALGRGLRAAYANVRRRVLAATLQKRASIDLSVDLDSPVLTGCPHQLDALAAATAPLAPVNSTLSKLVVFGGGLADPMVRNAAGLR